MSNGRTLPGYIEVKELGKGAQGQVVLAQHETGGTPVAIKYLASKLLKSTSARDTFRREAEVLQRVTDPHVARLFYFVEWQNGAAIIMEAVPGRSLRRVLDEQDKPLAPEAALAALKGSLLGLAAAHSAGIVHRDYKPANVLVQDDGQSKLIDFGIAVLTGQGDSSGTPAYMAPEQWHGEPATSATDLYAATCVFIECITGKKPYRATTAAEYRTQHIESQPPLDQVPEPLHPLIERGMAKDPSQRLWSAIEFIEELEEIAVRTYGPDWEQRGLIVFAAWAALVSTAVPLTLFGGALLAPGASGLGAGAGSGAIGSGAAGHAAGYAQGAATADVAAKTAGTTSKGFLAKLGGGKGVAGIGAAGAGAVAVGWLFWPSAPGIGGESQGAVHAAFTRPGVLLGQPNMPAAETPYIDLKISVRPARAKQGTTVKVITEFQARTVAGAEYLPGGQRQCFGVDADRPDLTDYSWGLGDSPNTLEEGTALLAFYQTPPAEPDLLPKTKNAVSMQVKVKISEESQPYYPAECAYLSHWTAVRTVTLPGPDRLPSGKYLVSPAFPMKIANTIRAGEEIPPESAGAVTEGRLPVLEVLEGG